ncbi:MAG: TraX family protein [Culicoidibacterales bacterium]
MNNQWQLTSFSLKVIALLTMTIDHIGYFLEGPLWMRAIGRIAFVLFAFTVAEGYVKTSNRKKYLQRLAVFGFGMTGVIWIIAICTNQWGYLTNGNIFLTFFFALLLVSGMRRTDVNGFIFITSALIGTVIFSVDYSFYGILTVVSFVYFQGNKIRQFLAFLCINILFYGPAVMMYGIWSPYSLQIYSLIAFVFIAFYHGQRGKYSSFIKWLFYWYYPIHIGILMMVSQYISF